VQKIGLEAVLNMGNFNKGVREYMKGISGMEKDTKKGASVFEKLGDSWATIAGMGASVAGAFYTVKKAYDFGKEGAAILQTKESFDRLMESMGVAPGVLGRLRDASLGTIDDMTLMSSTMTLLAGTSDEMGRQIVDASPKLLEIAKAAHKLNPALGDTAFLYESLARGIKRNSPLLIDNTGLMLKIGAANEAYAKTIGKTVEEMSAEDKQMALLTATLEAGDRMIQQVGGSVDEMGDSFVVAETEIKNATDTLKTKLAPVVADAVGFLADMVTGIEDTAKASDEIRKAADNYDEYLEAVLDAAMANHQLSQSDVDLIEKQAKAGEEFHRTVYALGIYTEEQYNAITAIEKHAGSIEDWLNATEPWVEREREAAKAAEWASASSEELFNQLSAGVQAADRWAGAADRAAKADLEIAKAAEVAAQAQDDFKKSMDLLEFAMSDELTGAIEEYQGELASLKSNLDEGIITQDEYTSSVQAATAAFQENTRAIAFNIAEKQILDALEKGLIQDTNASGTAFDEANNILWTLARTLGLTDQATIDFMQAVQEATGSVIDGTVSAEMYGTTVARIADQAHAPRKALKEIADQIREYQTQYTQTGAPPPVQLTTQQAAAQSVTIGTAYQHGGMTAGGKPILVGEAGPELFLPARPGGLILPNSLTQWGMNLPASSGAGGGGMTVGNTVNLTINPTINNQMDMAEFQALTLQTVQRAVRGI